MVEWETETAEAEVAGWKMLTAEKVVMQIGEAGGTWRFSQMAPNASLSHVAYCVNMGVVVIAEGTVLPGSVPETSKTSLRLSRGLKGLEE